MNSSALSLKNSPDLVSHRLGLCQIDIVEIIVGAVDGGDLDNLLLLSLLEDVADHQIFGQRFVEAAA